jgi:hypothetical protein
MLTGPFILHKTFLSQDMGVAVYFSVKHLGFTTKKDSRLNNCFIYILALRMLPRA